MTIFDYLATIDADYTNPGTKIQFFEDHATPKQVQSAGGLPYVIVEHLDDAIEVPMYDHENVLSQVIDITLYQAPVNDGTTPDKKKAMVVWEKIKDAVHNVDEHTFKRKFVELFYVTSLEPRRDRQTKGLFGSVRFEIIFTRG